MSKKVTDKDFKGFLGYGADSSVVIEQKPFSIKDLEESMEKMANHSTGPAQPLVMSHQSFAEFRKLFGGDYGKEYYANCAKFESFFHKGVVFEHKGSSVRWQVVTTFKHSGTKEVRCRIKSLSSGRTKDLANNQFRDFEIVEAPKAVTVLFGIKDE